jgi:hypothetical protein
MLLFVFLCVRIYKGFRVFVLESGSLGCLGTHVGFGRDPA